MAKYRMIELGEIMAVGDQVKTANGWVQIHIDSVNDELTNPTAKIRRPIDVGYGPGKDPDFEVQEEEEKESWIRADSDEVPTNHPLMVADSQKKIIAYMSYRDDKGTWRYYHNKAEIHPTWVLRYVPDFPEVKEPEVSEDKLELLALKELAESLLIRIQKAL